MKNYFNRFGLILVFAIFLACTDCSNNLKNTTINQHLLGKWTWVKSTGGIASISVTPESSEKTMQIEFTRNATLNKYVDGQEVYTSPYIIEIKEDKIKIKYTTLANFNSIGLGFDHQVEQEIKFVDNNKLMLIDPCCDNFLFEFIRNP